MEPRELAFYSFRNSTLAHRFDIRQKTAEETHIGDLINRTFGHHIAVFDPDGQFPEGFPRTDLPGASELAVHFYKNHYIDVKLHYDSIPERLISVDDFSRDVVFCPVDRTRNNLFFLLGEVGTGKTAFVNYLITRYGRQWVDSGKVWFLRLDVDLLGYGRLLTVSDLIKGIAEKLLRIFERHAEVLELPAGLNEKLDGLRSAIDGGGQHLQSKLSAFVRSYANITDRKLFLIIDNLDYVYHINDRTVFSRPDARADEAAIRCIADIVSAFRHDGPNGDLGDIAANVLFSLRPDSHEILRESMILFHPDASEDQRVITMVAPDWREVVDKRGKLLSYAITHQPKEGRRRIEEQIVQPILEDLETAQENNHSLIDHLLEITNFGLRGIIEFLASYSWLGNGSVNELTLGYERLMGTYPVGLLVFILGKKRRFSQVSSRFANIYLVSDRDEVMGENDQGALAPHTYWLSRLILHFIAHHEEGGEAVRTTNILACFCDGPSSYSELLVRTALGNMAQANITNLLRAKKVRAANDPHLSIQNISLTARGRHCLREVFDKFFYLQLVVDDHLLAIPRAALALFRLEELGVDYSYLCEQPRVYSEKLKTMIGLKARQVMLFLEILAVSFDREKLKYRDCFERLGQMHVPLPDMVAIRRGILGELRSLAAKHRGILDVDALDLEARDFRKSLEREFQSFYAAASRAGQ